jgi:hypothetical protein
MMDRDATNIPVMQVRLTPLLCFPQVLILRTGQVNFIDFVIAPLYISFFNVFPTQLRVELRALFPP